MRIQILPNWCKKMSLIIFLIASILSGGDDFVNGFNAGRNEAAPSYDMANATDTTTISDLIGGETVVNFFQLLAILALVGYILSREKVEDDYLNIIRLESYQIAFLLICSFALVLLIFNVDYSYGLFDSLTLFLWSYLIVFFVKKRIA